MCDNVAPCVHMDGLHGSGCDNHWDRFSANTSPALPLADLPADGPPALRQCVQLLLQQGAVRRGQLADDLLSGAAQRSHGGLVADQTFLQFLQGGSERRVQLRSITMMEPVATGGRLSSD